MTKRFLPLLLLVTGFATATLAQTAEKPKTGKEQSITIRKKSDSKDKMTIVVDGNNITINGKPLEDLADIDVEILRNGDLRKHMPGIAKRLAPLGRLNITGEDFSFGGNHALLGVVTEKTDKGAKISSVEKETAAEKMGLKKDDIITKVGEEKIEGSEDLYDAIGKYKPDDTVTITYLREGKPATATATLGKRKIPNLQEFRINGDNFNFDMPRMPDMPRLNERNFNFNYNYNRKPRLGLGIQDLAEGKGVKILDVDEDSPADKAGLKKGDLILEIDGAAINSVDELKSKVKDLKEGDSLKLTLQREGKNQTIDLKIPKKLKTADL